MGVGKCFFVLGVLLDEGVFFIFVLLDEGVLLDDLILGF